MEIKGNARRILKFLSERTEAKSFYPTTLYHKNHINVKSKDELDKEINILYESGLVDKEGENIQYFISKSHKYELSENGKQYLSHLLTEEEKNRTPIFSTINIHHQAGDNISIQGDGNTIIQESSLDKSQITPTIKKDNATTV